MIEEKLMFEKPTHVVHYISHWGGEGEDAYCLCVKNKEGVLYSIDTCKPILEYVVDRVIAEIELFNTHPVPNNEGDLRDQIEALESATSLNGLWSDKRHTLEVMLSGLREDLTKIKQALSEGE